MGNAQTGSKVKTGRPAQPEKSGPSSTTTTTSEVESSSLVRMVSVLCPTNLETFILIWLDPRVDSDRGIKAMKRSLKDVFTCCVVFDDPSKCEQYLKRSISDDRFVLVVSGRCGEIILPNIHDMPQIVDIYVYCQNKTRYQQLTSEFSKVRGVMTVTDRLIQTILKDQKNRENIEDSRSLSIIPQNHVGDSPASLSNASIWYQALLHVLLHHLPLPGSPDSLIQILREYSSEDSDGLERIKEFQDSYDSNRALSYIMNETPLVRFVIKALRDQDVHMMFALQFLLVDIRQQLVKYRLQSAHVFKWHIMSREQLDFIKSNPGQLLVVNGFLFTTKRLDNSLCPEKTGEDSDIVLFDIEAQYHNETSDPFADASNVEHCQHRKDEVIFMCGSVFQVESINRDLTTNTWRLRLRLGDKASIQTLVQTRQAVQDRDLSIVGKIIRECNETQKALRYYECLLRVLPYEHPSMRPIRRELKLYDDQMKMNQTQFTLLGFNHQLNRASKAMLKIIDLLTLDSLVVMDDFAAYRKNILNSKQKVVLFITREYENQIDKDMVKNDSKVFVLKDKNDAKYNALATVRDVIFQLADEVAQSYKIDAAQCTKRDELILAACKDTLVSRMFHELMEVKDGT